jgi:hypothetical protein
MRRGRPYRGADIWLLLRKEPGLTAEQIGARLNLYRPDKCLMMLERSGHVRRVRPTGPFTIRNRPPCTWFVVFGSRKPKDGRGKAPGSREALITEWRLHPNSLANLKSAKPGRIPKPATMLEACWGFPAISTLDETETTS